MLSVLSVFQVVRLQSKWIAQVLFKIFSQKVDVCDMVAQLKTFVLEGVTDEEQHAQVLSHEMADVMMSLRHVIYQDDEKLESALTAITGQVSSEVISNTYRPWSRVASMTQFKKLLHFGHSALSSKAMDRELSSKIEDAKVMMNKLKEQIGLVTCFVDAASVLESAVKLKQMAVPMISAASAHYDFAQGVVKKIDQD